MKKFNLLTALTFLILAQPVLSQVPKKIVVEHFTNTNCGNCSSRNPGFYTNLNSQTGVLHLAIHPSAPYASCLLYQQNATDNDARTNYYGIYGSTPRLVINGTVISSGANYSNSSIFTPYQSLTSPVSIRIVQQKFGTDSIRSTVIIKTEAANSLTGLSLFVALAEDSVFYTGGNSEPIHFDVFRKSLSAVTGDAVTLATTVGDSVMYTFSSASNAVWNFSRIYSLVILQETATKNLVQAEAVSPLEGVVTTGISNNIKQIEASVFPNPTDNFLTVQFNEATHATITVTDIDGKLIMQKAISQNQFKLDISSLPKAIYLINIKTEKGEFNQKFIKQ